MPARVTKALGSGRLGTWEARSTEVLGQAAELARRETDNMMFFPITNFLPF